MAQRETLAAVPDAAVAEVSTAAQSRTRSLAIGVASSLAGKAVGLLAPLVITPLTFGYLGSETFGLWMAVTSLTSMVLFADLGLGNGLMTRLARLRAEGDRVGAVREISSAYAVLGAVAIVLVLLLFGSLKQVDWPALFRAVDPGVQADVRPVVLICFGAFLLNIPLSLVQRVQYAHQEVGWSNLWQAAGSLLSIGLVYLSIRTRQDPMLVIAAGTLAIPLVNLANTLHHFVWHAPGLKPRLSALDLARTRTLLRLGVAFFVISVLSSLSMNLDSFLVGRVLGLHEAAAYAVALKLFALLALFITLVNLPLWPANGEALAQGDLAWVRRNTGRMMRLSVTAVALPGVGLVVFGEDLLRVWIASPDLAPLPIDLFAALATGSVLLACAGPLFMAQNSIGVLRPQLIGWSAFLVVSVPAKVFLAQTVGLTGVALATACTYAVTVLPAAVLGYRRTLATVAADFAAPSSEDDHPA